MMSSRLLRAAWRSTAQTKRSRRLLCSITDASSKQTSNKRHLVLGVSGVFAGCAALSLPVDHNTYTFPNAVAKCDVGRRPSGGEVVMLAPTKEPSTGILFPRLCNGMTFVGCGVRVKFGFVKIYAVGTYMDPIAMSAIKREGSDAIGKALLDPMYPRTIRIVMNRSLSIDKYTKAIVEALEPRMNGEDLDKLEEFKKMNPKVDLVEGAEMEMTIRGDTMLYKNSVGGVGAITSDVFCRALCDVYYGADAVSPKHKDEVIEGVKRL
uniref:Chalcone isomerase domain-containing protein n=1 Tax=Trieres chinensis TaxID=1514140 RepID=A0A7S2ED08_TRICV|mmetsp:Transcript_18352/g.37192  ORF Transcript_18352/g.37192 Transcript_18352/m.37192 type:complete len:265 (+) Transcript_18352:28-822(+)